jgi:hypothetical protein
MTLTRRSALATTLMALIDTAQGAGCPTTR